MVNVDARAFFIRSQEIGLYPEQPGFDELGSVKRTTRLTSA
jgi:hypothetical protein